MNARRITNWWLAILAFTVLAMGTAQAQTMPPVSAIKLAVVKVEMSGSVRLGWNRPASVKVDTFFVYRAEGDNMSKAVKIASIKDTAYTDMLPLTFVAVSKYSYYVVGKPATGSLITSNTVTVQMAGIPPVGSFKLEATTDAATATVKLAWTKPPVDSVVKYYVYRYGGFMSSIQKIDSTTGLTATDKPPLTAPAANTMSLDDYGDAAKYMFTYYIVAKLPAGSLQSTSASVILSVVITRDVVTFTTAPVTTAQVNVAYSAKVLAKSSDSTAKITYVLDEYPKGMTLDVTGATPLLKWNPAAKGMYDVRVIAKSSKNGSARQDYSITVIGGNGIVSGKVMDTTGAPIAKVIIQLMQRNRDSHSNFSTLTSTTGEYRFSKVDPGSYILQAIPTTPDYIGQWWNGKNNADNADTLWVYDSTAVPTGKIANFTLRGRIDPTKYVVVKGSVKDTLLIPINVKGTQVTFVRAEFALNSSTSSTDMTVDNFKSIFDVDRATDFRCEGNSKYTYKAVVDTLGNYSLKIPQGTYIALARAPGYAAEFFKEHADLLSADNMKLTTDSSNINFTLAPLPPVLLSKMSGSVLDTVNDIGVRARVIAFRDRWIHPDNFKMAKAYFTDTDSTGKYTFTDLLPGNYIVMAVPVGSYAPAYYTGGLAVDGKWKNVSRVVVDSGKNISGIDIIVKKISATKGGFTWISGRIAVGSAGLAGALVSAFDKTTLEPSGYGVSDANGNYAILGMAPGSYSVSVDKPGYTSTTTQTANPSYNLASFGGNTLGISNISLSVSADAVASVTGVGTQATSAIPTDFTVGQNYPNPFNPSTKFQFNLPTAQLVSVKVFDLLGREVTTLVSRQMNAGSYTIEWNAASMPSGVYFYRVEAGSASVVKKMILMK